MVGSGERIQSSCINLPAFHKIVRRKMVDYERKCCANGASCKFVLDVFLSALCMSSLKWDSR